jgi:cytochrome c oxidase subunit 3
MRIIDSLMEKPWLAHTGDLVLPQTSSVLPQRIALRFFLAAVSVLFFLFIVTFLARSQFADFIPLSGQPWQPFTDASQLWLNTGILLLASCGIQWAVYSSSRQAFNSSVITLGLVIALTILFLVAQYRVWQQLMALGFYMQGNPANSFYYLLTALHGMHLIGGLWVLARATIIFMMRRDLNQLHQTLSLCASYWHYLLVVWVILFTLLTSSSKTYAAIATLCGF